MLRRTVVIPLGLILNLNHNATIGAFSNLAKAQGKTLDLKRIVPEFLKIDAQFKTGKYSSEEFRQQILSLLDIKASDEEFDHAWNAMLGDLTKLSSQLLEMNRRNPHVDILWISKTNPIHVQAMLDSVGEEKLTNEKPLFFASYQSDAAKTAPTEIAEIAFYEEIVKKLNLQTDNTTLVLQCTSASPDPNIKNRDEKVADGIRRWGREQGFNILDREPTESVIASVAKAMHNRPQPMENIIKNYSGQVRLWGVSPSEKKLEEAESRHQAQSTMRL